MWESVALAATGAATGVTAALRWQSYRLYRKAETAYMVASMSLLTVALFLNVRSVTALTDKHVLGSPDSAVMVSQILAFGAAWAAIEMVAASYGQPTRRARRARLFILLAAAAALACAFLAPTRRPPEAQVAQFFTDTTRAGSPLLPYWIIFGGVMAAAQGYISLVSALNARDGDLWLRRSLRCISAGAAFSSLFAIGLLVRIAHPLPPALNLFDFAAVALGCSLVAVGVLIPGTAAMLWRRRARAQMSGLWANVSGRYPEVRYQATQPGLYRTVVEINDAVAEARGRDELNTPLLIALDALPERGVDEFASTVADMIGAAQRFRTVDVTL